MKERYLEAAKIMLAVVGGVGLVVVAAVAPGALQIAKLFEQDRYGNFQKSKRRSTGETIRRFQRNELFTVREKNGKFFVELTKKGKEKLKEFDFEKLHIAKPAKWDGKWRIVIFDIPDRSFKRGRDALRGKLKEWEFYLLQKSVWVCPWPCENEIRAVATLYEILPYVNIIVAEKIADDAVMRKHFHVV